MNKINLYTNDGGFVTEITVPPWAHPVELYMWGERFFIRRPDGRYMEAEGAFWIPPQVSGQDVATAQALIPKLPAPQSEATPTADGEPT
jgi:hypothetical protein